MAGCVRSPNGFYSGGDGVTPSPTPTTTDACYYRGIVLDGSAYRVLVDDFGRILTDDVAEGSKRAFAWNDEGFADGFSESGTYSTEFARFAADWGVDAGIVSFGEDTVTVVGDDDNVELQYTPGSLELTPIVSQLTNGLTSPTMFTRTLNDGTDDVTFVCDADGKICTWDNGSYFLTVQDDQFVHSNNASMLAVLETAAGGSTAITVSANGDYHKYTLDGYSFITNDEAVITFGEVDEIIEAELEGGGKIIPVSISYISGEGLYLESGQVTERETLTQIPVVIDTEGNKHVIRCTMTSSKFYGLYLGSNAPGYAGVWWQGIDADGVSAPVETGSYMPDSFTTWLFDHGLNGQVYWDAD